jgi:hypothetical protein
MQHNKEFVVAITLPSRPARESVLAQGPIEKAFPDGLEACTERVRFSKEERFDPFDGGLAMKRGILGGAAAEHELYQFASDGIFTIDLGELVDRIQKNKRIGGFAADQQEQMRSSVIKWVRQYQAGFPPQDEDLDWSNISTGPM